MIYILGFKGFIAKHIYLMLKKINPEIILLSHTEINLLKGIKSEDIVINCCGVNRGENVEDFNEGNYTFIKTMCEHLKEYPYLIHLSSLMVYGFKNNECLSDYQKWFIQSKLKGEKFLIDNYDKTRLCIVRPSNVYGYDCLPYYNNLLTTLVYEKINGLLKINRLNKNCIRNMISVNSLVSKISQLVFDKTPGIFNIVSSNDLSLEDMVKHLYNEVPDHIDITDDSPSVLNFDNKIQGETITIFENFTTEIKQLEKNMKDYYNLLDKIYIQKKDRLTQPRGDMVEITNLKSTRLYKITITQNSVRGNHYHYEQIEDFYINSGKVLFLLAPADSPEVIHMFLSSEDELVRINPTVIHTVCNDFVDNVPEIIVSSTQEYIPNKCPDTKYVNLL